MFIYRILNYPDTNIAAGNCHAKFNCGSSPYLGEWDVTASQKDVGRFV